jgi:hypothetical protein
LQHESQRSGDHCRLALRHQLQPSVKWWHVEQPMQYHVPKFWAFDELELPQ